ncbi:MAG TPA: outer membrane beta-barrel protein [Candidatus Dormibacteraeota bacterium]|nr:outer membrane beta-barrel protein [Candidatus Dormibacteraeota bacterium]
MKISLFCALACLLGPTAALGQSGRNIELFGGYSYLNFDLKRTSATSLRLSANGGEASISAELFKHLSVEGDFSGHYSSFSSGTSMFFFMAGPKVMFSPADQKATGFVHALVGGSTLGSYGPSRTAFVVAVGGGVDYKVAQHFAVRLIQADYIRTDHSGIVVSPQNNIRLSAGAVYRF